MQQNNVEIERKYIVDKDVFIKNAPSSPSHITQSYWRPDNVSSSFGIALDYLVLNQEIYGDRPVIIECAKITEGGPQSYEMRVRQKDNQYFLTFKSKTELPTGGVEEYEYMINKILASTLTNASDFTIEKNRYVVPLGDLNIEVDVFSHVDLVLAEIEVPSMDTPIENLPEWITKEVTGDPKFTNRYLAEFNSKRQGYTIQL